MARYVISSESVTEGHPDKMCDKVSDAVLDAALAQDPESRVACETATKTGLVHLYAEITSNANLDYDGIVRKTIADIGYTRGKFGFDAETCAVGLFISKQSPDISQGVTGGQGDFKEQGAGDQGMMYGYACDETVELMPTPIMLAHKLTRRLVDVRKSGVLRYLRPDGKSQVAVEYDGNKPVRLQNIIIASQHADMDMAELRRDILREVILPVCECLMDENTEVFINATGRFVIGGPMGDSGFTGRKIIVDTYGSVGRHGGGAFSGKDPSKVDRSGAYAARYIAKNIVASGMARRCEVQLAYCIGVAKPTSIRVDTFGTGNVLSDSQLEQVVYNEFPVKPADIIKTFELKHPKGWSYCDTAAYGHFGREGFPWENTDRVEVFRKYLPR